MEEEMKRIFWETLVKFYECYPNFQLHPKIEKRTMNIKELSEYINKSDSWIRHNRDKLPAPISPKPLTWHKDAIDEWLDLQRKPIENTKIITPNFEVKIGKAK